MKTTKFLLFLITLIGASHPASAVPVQVRPDEPGGKLLIVDTEYNDDLTIMAPQVYPVLVGNNIRSSYTYFRPYRSESASTYSTFKYIDHWIEQYSAGSSNTMPYIGIDCNGATPCNSDNTYPFAVDAIGNDGIWKMRNNVKIDTVWYYRLSNVIIPKILQKLVSVGDTYSHVAHNCGTSAEYDYGNRGQRCVDMSSGYWQSVKRSWRKEGHFTIKSSSPAVDLTLDSNGNVWPDLNKCEVYSYSGKDGVLCRLLEYNFNAVSYTLDRYTISPFLGNRSLMAKLSNQDVAVTVDRQNWASINQNLIINRLKNRNYIEYFISNDVFKNMVTMNLQGISDGLFRIKFSTPSWGDLYETATPTQINLTARKYIVSITPTETGSVAYREGRVGKDILDFGYQISESGPTSAGKLEVMLQQDVGTPYNRYCTFYQTDAMSLPDGVAIPSYLRFKSSSGNTINQDITCDGQPVDLRKLNIVDRMPPLEWNDPIYGQGLTRFYDLSLQFDLTNDMSKRTISGQQWEGTRQQSGTLTVRATWD